MVGRTETESKRVRKELKVVIYLEWKERCFRVNESDLGYLRSLLPKRAKLVRVKSDAAFKRELKDATHVITWHFKREWYALAPHLKLLATPAAGKELIELPGPSLVGHSRYNDRTPAASLRKHCTPSDPRGILHFGHFHGEIMAENVAAFLLAFARGFFTLGDLRNGTGSPDNGVGAPPPPHQKVVHTWPRAWLSRQRVFTLAGTRAVIAGYGKVGRAIGAKLAALGVEVVGLSHADCDALVLASRSQYNDCEPAASLRKHCTPSDPRGLFASLRSADFFILALPSTTGTDDFLDARLLAKLPRRCCVVNVGRGNAIDERALVAALRRGRLAGAYLDVLKYEPSGTVPLFKGADVDLAARWPEVPNLFVTPHSSAFAADYLRRSFDELHRDGCLTAD